MWLLRPVVVYTIFLLVALFVSVLYIIGAARYITDLEDNTCDMTYIFEYPQYVRVALDNDAKKDAALQEEYPRFELYAYGEGFVTERIRRMIFTGIPVLFIPGNAGSHEQVRSLASVSLRKSLKSRTPFHFDYFTVSLGNDYSALYGGVIMEETNFVAICIQRILELYQGKVKNLVLIGHSTGGVIAKGALLLVPGMSTDFASILIALATPHKPYFYPDASFAQYYTNLARAMVRLEESETTVVSIGGGPRDTLVTTIQIIDEFADMNAVSTSIPEVWRPIDHRCILWCKQLVITIVRALFDAVDTSQRPAAISANPINRRKALAWHLFQRYSGEKQIPKHPYMEKVEFPDDDSNWIEDMRRQYTWSIRNYTNENSKIPSNVFLMVNLMGPYDSLTIDVNKLKVQDWIFVCSASSIKKNSRVCKWGWNLSNRTRFMPDPLRKLGRKVVDLDLNEMRALSASHVIVKIPTRPKKYDAFEDVVVRVDLHSRSIRYVHVREKPWKLDRGNIRYLAILEGITDAISVQLESYDCTDNKPHYSLVELIESRNIGAKQIFFFKPSDNEPKTMKILTEPRRSNSLPAIAELRITLDTTCAHLIRIRKADVIDKISCMVRDRWTVLYPTIVGVLLLIIGQRVDSHSADNNPEQHGTKNFTVLLVTLALCISLGIVIEFCVVIIALIVLTITACCSVIFFGAVIHNIAVKFLARAITFSTTWSGWILSGLVNQLPQVTTVLLLSVIPVTCGAIAMLLSVCLHYMRLTQMYEDYLEEMLFATMRHFHLLKKRTKDNNTITRHTIFNHLLLFMVWCIAALPAIPTALIWAKHFSYSTRLTTEDPVLMYSWVVMVACGTLGLVKIPVKTSTRPYRSQILATSLRCLGWVVLVSTATPNQGHYLWCFPPCLAAVVTLISIHSSLA